ncbi:hypothetical protein NPX13_g1474 [Xylaria arbuscula]|uniref:Nephrocystin 3-like N-terminal domain-containing protein n=1 Tax=Xylaria arbuscula TaxID=114810 RepID=A0A9W8NKZ3_9PEZI|nr:hypothetical protein NPX13_g1474 [Xylaria arbuscula]
MEPPFGISSLVRNEYGSTRQSVEASPGQQAHGQSWNSFDGLGVQNTGGLTVGRDLIINADRQSNANTEAKQKRKNLEKKRQILLESLRFEQMDARRWSIRKAHTYTCAWFLETPEYVNWVQKNTAHNDHNFLWIKGKPGAGKSTLMKFLLEQLREQTEQSTSETFLLSFFFNARGNDLERSTAGLYRSLLVQLLEARNDMHHVLDNVQIGHLWTIGSLKCVFEKAVRELPNASFICLIDALDESEEGDVRDMISFLSDTSVTQNRFRICFASRHYPHITINTGLGIVLEAQMGHKQDIERYIDSRLVIQNQVLAGEIRQALQAKASGVFMWVVLVVSILNREHDAGNEHILHERIQQLPGDLEELFLDIQRAAITTQMRSGLSYAFYTIKRYILTSSKGLTELTKSETSAIQFIHESVRDFFLKEDGLIRIWPSLSGNVTGKIQDILKKCCLTYVTMEQVAHFQEDSIHLAHHVFPFLPYAHGHILHHAEQAQIYGVNQQDFLAVFPLHEWLRVNKFIKNLQAGCRYTPQASLLYILAGRNSSALIHAHPNRQSCFKIEREPYIVPILAAYATGSHEAMRTLLELEAYSLPESTFAHYYRLIPHFSRNTHARPNFGNFIFTEADDLLQQLIQYGTEKVSLLYLAMCPYDINAKDLRGRTLLCSAIERGFDVLARALLEEGAEISAPGNFGYTPLHTALVRSDTKLAQLLIEHGANISVANNLGYTPLQVSLFQRDLKMARILVKSGANISGTDAFGNTALHIAVHANDIELAELLISYGADVLAAANIGRTPLHIASLKGIALDPRRFAASPASADAYFARRG